MTLYDFDYFINKFEAIPKELWCVGQFRRGKKRCALGHCGEIESKTTEESCKLQKLFMLSPDIGTGASASHTNDYQTQHDPATTPKQRILNRLKELKKFYE